MQARGPKMDHQSQAMYDNDVFVQQGWARLRAKECAKVTSVSTIEDKKTVTTCLELAVLLWSSLLYCLRHGRL